MKESKADETWHFWVAYTPPGQARLMDGFHASVGGFDNYRKLARILEKKQVLEQLVPDESHFMQVALPAGSWQLGQVLNVLKDEGLVHRFTRRVPLGEAHAAFPVERVREVTAARLDACEWVRLIYSDARLGLHVGQQGTTAVGRTDPGRRAQNVPIGALSPTPIYGVTKQFISRAKKAGLHGLAFEPLEWTRHEGAADSWKEPTQRFWLTTAQVAPACLTPRTGLQQPLLGLPVRDNADLDALSGPNRFCGWDDEGRSDLVLRFNREAMEALRGVDIAQTREWLRFSELDGPRWQPDLIVSRKFRTWCLQEKFRLQFGPCELVDPCAD